MSVQQIGTLGRLEFGGDPFSNISAFVLPVQVGAGDTVSFSTNGHVSIVSWDDDSPSETGQTFTHTYTAPGQYDITVVSEAPEGVTDFISNNGNATGDISLMPTSVINADLRANSCTGTFDPVRNAAVQFMDAFGSATFDFSMDWSSSQIETLKCNSGGRVEDVLTQAPYLKALRVKGTTSGTDLSGLTASNTALESLRIDRNGNNMSRVIIDAPLLQQMTKLNFQKLSTNSDPFDFTTDAGGDLNLDATDYTYNRLIRAFSNGDGSGSVVTDTNGDPIFGYLEIDKFGYFYNYNALLESNITEPVYTTVDPDGNATSNHLNDGDGNPWPLHGTLHPDSIERLYGSAAMSGQTSQLQDASTYTYGNQGYEPLICVVGNVIGEELFHRQLNRTSSLSNPPVCPSY